MTVCFEIAIGFIWYNSHLTINDTQFGQWGVFPEGVKEIANLKKTILAGEADEGEDYEAGDEDEGVKIIPYSWTGRRQYYLVSNRLQTSIHFRITTTKMKIENHDNHGK